MYVCIYTYICMERKRERESEREGGTQISLQFLRSALSPAVRLDVLRFTDAAIVQRVHGHMITLLKAEPWAEVAYVLCGISASSPSFLVIIDVRKSDVHARLQFVCGSSCCSPISDYSVKSLHWLKSQTRR